MSPAKKRREIVFAVLILCLINCVHSSDEDESKPSKEQLKSISVEVCDLLVKANGGDKKNATLCQETFLNSTSQSSIDEATSGNLTVMCQSEERVYLEVPSRDSYQIIILFDKYDTTLQLYFSIVPPNERHTSVSCAGYGGEAIWYAAITSEGALSSWYRGPDIGSFYVNEDKFVLNMTINITFSGETPMYSAVAEIQWDEDMSNECFQVSNACFNQEVNKEQHETQYVGPMNGGSLSFKKLVLNGACSVEVSGPRGTYSRDYKTPACINQTHCMPEMPHISSISTTRQSDNGSWDVTVHWWKPHIQPLMYIIKVNNTYAAEVDGSSMWATVSGVVGDVGEDFYVEVIAQSEITNSHRIDNAVLQQELSATWWWALGPAAAAAAALAAAAAAAALAAAALCALRTRCARSLSDYYEKPVDKNSGAKLLPECDVVIAEDRWEIRADRLVLHEVIGEGAFGVVRRGTLAPGAKEVAVKMLKEWPTREEIRSFLAEMELMKGVGAHAHVVSLAGCRRGRRPMILVEYCARGDLLNYLRSANDYMTSKRNAKYIDANENKTQDLVINKMYDAQKDFDGMELTTVDLLSFCRQIAMGMEFLASNRVVHRDLAARNVLVCSDRTLKIADFGLSRDVYQENQYKQKGSAMLPIKWMALESLLQNVYTTQSDVWSFGVVMWEVSTVGGAPYPALGARRLPAALRAGHRLPRPVNASHSLYSLMLSCWAERPRERPTFTSLLRALDAELLRAAAHSYVALGGAGVDDPPAQHQRSGISRYMPLLPRTKRYWLKKLQPIQPSQSNHYTSSPDTIRSHNIV